MNAARHGADQRNIPPRTPVIVISDNEDDYDDEDLLGSESSLSPTPPAVPPPHQADNSLPVFARAPAPYGPPNPAEPVNSPDNAAWQNYINLDDDNLNRFEGFDDLDVRDAELERIIMEEYNNIPRFQPAVSAIPIRKGELSGQNRENDRPEPELESKVTCVDNVVAVFPGICRDHVSNLYDTMFPASDRLIGHILDKIEKGESYPTAREIQKSLKRKRNLDEDEEAVKKYGAMDRVMPAHLGNIRTLIRTLLSVEFPETPMAFIDVCLAQSGHRLFSAYRVLEEAHRTFDIDNPAYNKIKNARKVLAVYQQDSMEELIASVAHNPDEVEILKELEAARRIRRKADAKRQADYQLELDEEENVRKAEAEGTMSECGCCFGDFPLNRMIHCDNEKTLHWFCRGCARQTAETEIGKSKYHLKCMSMDACEAGFSFEQRNQFLDENTIIALERNEQEAVLRMAGIENLASCPFCPYAAEYPKVDVDREFRCQAPDCEKVSCRLCKLESHIPKSCEEHAKENGLSIRRQIEEAMSAALIRKCNKCGTPFVKEEGCNKMTCTRNGCYNIQCYVCSKSCGYDHFDDTRRGGKTGNCPLFESVEQRHDDEVKKAEKEALQKVMAEHPEYTEEDLTVKVSERVREDDERRKNANPHARLQEMHAVLARDQARIPGLHVRPGIREQVRERHEQMRLGRQQYGPRRRLDGLQADGLQVAPRQFPGNLFDVEGDLLFNGIWDNLPDVPRLQFGDPVGPPPELQGQIQRVLAAGNPLRPAPRPQAEPQRHVKKVSPPQNPPPVPPAQGPGQASDQLHKLQRIQRARQRAIRRIAKMDDGARAERNDMAKRATLDAANAQGSPGAAHAPAAPTPRPNSLFPSFNLAAQAQELNPFNTGNAARPAPPPGLFAPRLNFRELQQQLANDKAAHDKRERVIPNRRAVNVNNEQVLFHEMGEFGDRQVANRDVIAAAADRIRARSAVQAERETNPPPGPAAQIAIQRQRILDAPDRRNPLGLGPERNRIRRIQEERERRRRRTNATPE